VYELDKKIKGSPFIVNLVGSLTRWDIAISGTAVGKSYFCLKYFILFKPHFVLWGKV